MKKENNKIYYFIELIYWKFDLTGFRNNFASLVEFTENGDFQIFVGT